jgi:hypothetical protein
LEEYTEANKEDYAEDLMGRAIIIYTTMFMEQLSLIICG